jgi:16S rRNA (cytidine1402-2'-O)-methyltransferase
MGTLYLVATPIGNLEDMTFRAISTLKTVDLIAAEDTRHSGRLLKHFDIKTPMISFHGHSGESRVEEIMNALSSGDVAVITDAGMPGISDPGVALVRAAIDAGYRVEPIPGASAVTAAVAVSGLVEAGFLFAGFPPRRSKDRREFYERAAQCGYPVVIYESPHRIAATLDDLAAVFPDARVALCRELTKMYEEVLRGSATEIVSIMSKTPPRGEVALVFDARGAADDELSEDDIERLARRLLEEGQSASGVAKEIARTAGIKRAEAYAVVLKVKDES